MVAALFVAALVALWTTGASVVARERRRVEAKDCSTARRRSSPAEGREIIAGGRGSSRTVPEDEWRRARPRALGRGRRGTRGSSTGIEGGYLVRDSQAASSAPRSRPSRPKPTAEEEPRPRPRAESSLPPLEADLIDIQVDAAIRKKQVLFSVEELEGDRPVTVAIRTAPVGGRRARRRGDLGDDPAGRPALRRPLAPGLPAGRGPGPGRDRAGVRAHRGPGADRPPAGGRAGPAPDRPAAERAAGGPGQAAGGRGPRGPQPAGRHPLDGPALAARVVGLDDESLGGLSTRSTAWKRSSPASSSSRGPTPRTWPPAT